MAVVVSVVVMLALASSADALQVSVRYQMLFGSEEGIRRHKNNILFSTPNGSNSEITDKTKQSSSSSSSTSFLGAIDSFGMKLKPWAIGAHEKSLIYINKDNGSSNINGTDTTTSKTSVGTRRNNRFKRILYSLQSTILWVLYILYRGYRGFFVILPAVFKEVYRQLGESNLVLDVYGGDDDEKEYAVNSNAVQQQPQLQESLRLRTRITISILSAVLTLSYVVGGALRVLGK